jgi:hypothetical protein
MLADSADIWARVYHRVGMPHSASGRDVIAGVAKPVAGLGVADRHSVVRRSVHGSGMGSVGRFHRIDGAGQR